MWTRLLPLDFKDHYTALLGISKASKLDEGIYTCQVKYTRVTVYVIKILMV